MQWNGISLSLTSTFVFSVAMVSPNQSAINWYRSGFAWRKQRYHGRLGKTQTVAVLLAFPALFCCSSRTLGSGPCGYSAGLRFRQRSHLGFFPSTGIPPGGSTQHSFQKYWYCCQVYRCCLSWLAVQGKGVRTGFGSSVVGCEYICQEHATSKQQTTVFLLHQPVLCPACSHPSLVWWWHCLVSLWSNSHWLLIVSIRQLYSSRLPLSECHRQKNVLK